MKVLVLFKDNFNQFGNFNDKSFFATFFIVSCLLYYIILCILLPIWYNKLRRRNKKKNFASDTGQALTSRLTMLSLQRILIFQRLSSCLSRVSLLMIIHGLIDTRLDRSSITCFSMEKFHGSLLLVQCIVIKIDN